MNPAAGQFPSLSDMITVVQTLHNPPHPKSQLSEHSMHTWLQLAHAFEEDDWTETGLTYGSPRPAIPTAASTGSTGSVHPRHPPARARSRR